MLSQLIMKVTSALICFIVAFGAFPGAALAAGTPESDVRADAQRFIDEYSAQWRKLIYAASLAEWRSNTMIVEGDDTNKKATIAAEKALADFTGGKANIERASAFLKDKAKLTPLQVKQLEQVLFKAAGNPEIVKDLVAERIAAETAQNERLYGFDFKFDGKSTTPNDIDNILRESSDLAQRRRAWEASKEVGVGLKDGLADLRGLRNGVVKPLGYSSLFSYQSSQYGLSADEIMALMRQFNRELRPLYRELHTYARYELAKKYGRPVPDQIPADWLPNRWGQNWSDLVNVEGMDINAALKDKSPEWVVKQAEDFYVSLGFPRLAKSFWDNSSLYPPPLGAGYKKNNHASAWHLDNDKDIRSLMSVEPNADWYETAHHELGHVYYFISYSNPDVPMLLRDGASPAYHEAMGTMIGMAAMQKPFLAGRGLVSRDAKVDQMQALLKEALDKVVFIPFSAGTMSEFEYDLYEKNLPRDEFNKRWWELARKYQGIEPPTARDEKYCDACSKTHINDDPASYYDYALSFVLLFQLHDHIARNILKQDPHATDYYGNRQVGDFLRKIMSPGASRDWRVVLRENTGEDLSARAMLRYFEPLMAYLKKVNAGRKYTLEELPAK